MRYREKEPRRRAEPAAAGGSPLRPRRRFDASQAAPTSRRRDREGTWIGYDTLIEPAYPRRVVIGRRVAIGMRVLILAHFAHHGRNKESSDGTMDDRVSVRIEDDAFIGPGVLIMPNVTIGAGAVVAAGSVVTRSVAPLTMVQGNPAKPIARCGIPLGFDTPIKEFYRRLTPIAPPAD